MDDQLLKKMERIESILDADYKKDGTVDAVLASLKKAIEAGIPPSKPRGEDKSSDNACVFL